jgi:hypothetical protein
MKCDVLPNRRRWLRFSLRTMLVGLTVVGCWLGYYGHWHRQRSDALEWINVHQGWGNWLREETTPRSIPWSLYLWGDRPVAEIWIANQIGESLEEFDARAKTISGLFPEAQIRVDRWPYAGAKPSRNRAAH